MMNQVTQLGLQDIYEQTINQPELRLSALGFYDRDVDAKFVHYFWLTFANNHLLSRYLPHQHGGFPSHHHLYQVQSHDYG